MLSLPFFFFFFFCLFRLHSWHMEVPRLGVESELQLPAYATATATKDLSHVHDLYHSSWQCWIPDPLSKARDRTYKLMDISQIHFCCTTTGNSSHFWILDNSLVCCGYKRKHSKQRTVHNGS